jgi:hypothetical protein
VTWRAWCGGPWRTVGSYALLDGTGFGHTDII